MTGASSLTHDVYQRLRGDLLACRLMPGQKLKIDELCVRFGAGSSAVREALSRLAADGFVVIEPQRGFRVTPLSFAELRDLTNVRCEIEGLCIRDAIEHGGIDWETNLIAALHRLSKTPERDPQDPQRYNDAFALSAGALPKVMPSGGLMLDYGVDGAGLVVPEYPTLDFGAGDFTILMVVGFNHGGIGKTFFLKQNNPPGDFPKQLVMEWLIATPPDFSFVGFVNETEFVSGKPTGAGVERVYGLRRIGDDVQLRVNGNIVNTGTLLTRGASTDSNGNIYLGSRGGLDFETVDTIRAAIMIGGSLTDQEVGALEAWLLAAFGIT